MLNLLINMENKLPFILCSILGVECKFIMTEQAHSISQFMGKNKIWL